MTPSQWLRRLLRVLAPALLAVAAASCGPYKRHSAPAATFLFFTNESLYQAEVYVAIPGVTARRIGTVMAGRTDTLVVPADLATRGGTLNIVARLPPGRGAPQTGPVSILPGDRYAVRLPLDARLLSFLRTD